MNTKILRFIIGWVLVFEAGFLLVPMVVGIIYKESRIWTIYLIVAGLCLAIGMILKTGVIREPQQLYIREGFASVSLSWFLLSIFGALPFVLTGEIPSFTDALFEVVSGLTTTGASILSDVEALSRASLFWRCFTHWIGGMGVFVFIMAILPMAGAHSINLMRAESPGPSVGKFVPKLRDSAMLLYLIYIGITVIGFFCYLLSGMPVYDALTMIFGTVGTGGFGIYNDSCASFTPLQINLITTFMILSGVNYSVYFAILTLHLKEIFSFEEVRYYLMIIAASIGIISFNIRPMYASLGETLRQSSFHVASIITTSGFSATDFDMWPELSKNVLILLMVVGACAGSTGGGLKVSRVLILFKSFMKEIRSIIHPGHVKKLYLDKQDLSEETLRSTNAYAAVYAVILVASILAISLDGCDFTTNFTAVLATLNNIGPGMNLVGPTQNFAFFSDFSKWVFIFDMLAGRLELFPVLILFMPSCWRRY